MVRTLDEDAVRRAITPARAIAAVREAFRADGERRTTVPPVINLEIPAHRGEFHVKTAYVRGLPHVAVKIASGFYDNARRGLPSGSGMMALFDATTGLPSALLLDNGFLTDIRTGAAGAIAADVLANRTIDVVGIIGSGIQARHQLRCLRVVRDFRRVVAWSPTAEHLHAYVDEMRGEGYDTLAAASPEGVCADADLLITATPSRHPLMRADWLRAGMHVTAVGSDSPGKQELEAGCFARADVVAVDRLSQAAAFGDLSHAVGAGLFHLARAVELGAIVAGLAPGRIRDDQITIADLTGVGFQDTAIANAVMNAASIG
jgi:ornithine cyclodeaminase